MASVLLPFLFGRRKQELYLEHWQCPINMKDADGHVPHTSTYPSALGSKPLFPNALVRSRVTHVFHPVNFHAAGYLSPESPPGVYLLKSLAIWPAPRTSME